MKELQYDLFENLNFDFAIMQKEVKEMQVSLGKIRKSIFARHTELAQMYLDLTIRLEGIEKKFNSK